MSSVNIHPSIIQGLLQAPASKSCMQRACAAALLKGGKTIIHNYGMSNDDNAAIEIIKQFDASVLIENDALVIESRFSIINNQQSIISLNCQESGLSLRMFTPIAALLNQTVHITGSGSLLNRPADFFDEILPQLSITVKSNNGKLPLTITGSLQANDINIDGSLSSQFLTGLLFAYSFKNAAATITVNNLISKPYIDLTLQVMQDFGLNIPVNNNYTQFVFTNQSINQSINQPMCYKVEGDWSNAAFLLVAGAIAGSVTVKGLNLNSTQADKAILEVLKMSNCDIKVEDNEISVTNTKPLNAFTFDATDCPDLFPPLVAFASYCNGTSSIKGVSRLQYKESNRACSLQKEFAKMGAEIELNDDIMLIEGKLNIKGSIVDSHNDHRIAMACAVAALKANGRTTILNADAINKSYPNFYKDLKRVGVCI
jgi:3-phosphoshikimate 1-carboxyvinyltransferase